ncbi:MAG: sulfate transporter family protein [Pseudolabrys sp.]|nr:sulfate transporter family protein [Pseudolabrys sp.]
MVEAVGKALAQLFMPPLRAILMKAVGLALALLVVVGIALHRALAALALSGAEWAEQATGYTNHAAWAALAWLLSILAGFGIVTGALFIMPAVTSFIAGFFVDETAEAVERRHYPAEPAGRALPLMRALAEGGKIGLLAIIVYLCTLPFVLTAGLGIVVLFLANSYLLGRMYFELAAMRFRSPREAKDLRRANASHVFLAGMVIAVFVSIPIVNFATPVFAMAFMVHVHKAIAGRRAELIEPVR